MYILKCINSNTVTIEIEIQPRLMIQIHNYHIAFNVRLVIFLHSYDIKRSIELRVHSFGYAASNRIIFIGNYAVFTCKKKISLGSQLS